VKQLGLQSRRRGAADVICRCITPISHRTSGQALDRDRILDAAIEDGRFGNRHGCCRPGWPCLCQTPEKEPDALEISRTGQRAEVRVLEFFYAAHRQFFLLEYQLQSLLEYINEVLRTGILSLESRSTDAPCSPVGR
jgi:hypothetical protein